MIKEVKIIAEFPDDFKFPEKFAYLYECSDCPFFIDNYGYIEDACVAIGHDIHIHEPIHKSEQTEKCPFYKNNENKIVNNIKAVED